MIVGAEKVSGVEGDRKGEEVRRERSREVETV